jgi:large subunit ribosomal protein L6
MMASVAKPEDKKEKALWGLTRALIQNLVDGVTKGFEKKLEVNGVGFKIALQGQVLVLNLGFSHPINVDIPKGIEVAVDKNVITITGSDKQLVGQFAANIRELKKPEPYKGKGIKYIDEVILRKAGKVVKAVGK